MAAVLHGHVGEPVSQASLCAAAQQQHEHAGAVAHHRDGMAQAHVHGSGIAATGGRWWGDGMASGSSGFPVADGARVQVKILGRNSQMSLAHLAVAVGRENWSGPAMPHGLGRLMDSAHEEKRITFTQSIFHSTQNWI
jgi:hypothetical protein